MRQSNFRIRWDRIGGVFVLGLLAGAGAVGCLAAYDSQDIPPCTDRVATDGGICEGALVEEVEDYSDVDRELEPLPAESSTVPDWVPATITDPCPVEDSWNCYWDAANMGNGDGSSFWTDAEGETHYPVFDEYENDPPVDEPTAGTGEVPADWPYTTGETLVCGQDAKPAIDYREDVGWWAYCEPALID